MNTICWKDTENVSTLLKKSSWFNGCTVLICSLEISSTTTNPSANPSASSPSMGSQITSLFSLFLINEKFKVNKNHNRMPYYSSTQHNSVYSWSLNSVRPSIFKCKLHFAPLNVNTSYMYSFQLGEMAYISFLSISSWAFL